MKYGALGVVNNTGYSMKQITYGVRSIHVC